MKFFFLIPRLAEQTQCATQSRFQIVYADLLLALFLMAALSTIASGLFWYLSWPKTERKVRQRKNSDVKSDRTDTRARISDFLQLEHSAYRYFFR